MDGTSKMKDTSIPKSKPKLKLKKRDLLYHLNLMIMQFILLLSSEKMKK